MLIGMETLSSRGSRGKAPAIDGEADWRRNRCFLPPWNEQPKCTCPRLCIIDVWKYDGTKWPERRYFNCADMDPDFMIWW
jgi:hypothetical protein